MPTISAMGTLYLVRHGQASFGADDYDQLSALGRQQSLRLGEYWRERGVSFDTVLTGTLRRQVQTWEAVAEGAGWQQQALSWPGLNEFDSEAVIAAIHPHPLVKPTNAEETRQHFRLLRDGLTQWMAGTVSPQGMASYHDFVHGVTRALDHVRQHCSGRVLMVSSGGPIATAVGHILGTPPETTIELNLRIRNSAVSELSFNAKHHRLVTYNTLPHLDGPAWADWVSYA